MKITLPNITPGPWGLDRAGVNVIDPKEKREYVLAHCRESQIRPLEANARAIAALPLLLQQLAFLVESVQNSNLENAMRFENRLTHAKAALMAAGATLE